MKHFLQLFFILFCCTVQLSAYSDNCFKEGYIISLKGDTIKGFLLEQQSKNASETCIFKPNANSDSKTYKPGEITAYKYTDGKYYISKGIEIDSTTTKVVFLEYLIKGMASVYYYVDHKEHYYIEKLPNGLTELTEEQTTFYKNGRNYLTPPKYKGKLMAQLNDWPGISYHIQNASLTHKSLIKLAKDYHENVCNTESCIIYEKANTSAKVKFGVVMGLSKNQYNFGNQINTNYGNNFQIGAGLKISNIFMFNRHMNLKVNLIFEKDLEPYTFSLQQDIHNYPVTINNEIFILNDIDYGGGVSIPYLPTIKGDLDVLDLKIPIILNFDINISKKTTFTIGAGISNKIILSQNENFKVNYFYEKYDQSIRSWLTGLIATIGIERNLIGNHNFFVNVSYEYLLDYRSRIDREFKLFNDQFSLQTGIYF